MSATKSTVVISHGAFQPSPGYEPLVEQLIRLGHPAEVVPLPSVGGTSSPLPGFDEDIKAVREALTRHSDDGKDVILLCHSYGGLVGSCAVEGFDISSRKKDGKSGGVILVVYMTAFMIPKGRSMLDMLGGQPLPWMKVEGDKCTPDPSSMLEIAFNDMPVEKGQLYSSQVTHSSASVFAEPSTFEPWSNEIPCAYIHCEIDYALPLPMQQQMVAQLGPNPNTASLKAGHCPFISMPDQLADAVAAVAKIQVA